MNETSMALATLLIYEIMSVGLDTLAVIWLLKKHTRLAWVVVIVGSIGTLCVVPKIMGALAVSGISADIFAALASVNIGFIPIITIVFSGLWIYKKIQNYKKLHIWI